MKSSTDTLRIHGYHESTDFNAPLYYYGTDREKVDAVCTEHTAWKEKIHPLMPYLVGEIIWAVREEMCLHVEDFLARRTRMLFLDALAAIASAPMVAKIMAEEMRKDEAWIRAEVDDFTSIAFQYLPGK